MKKIHETFNRLKFYIGLYGWDYEEDVVDHKITCRDVMFMEGLFDESELTACYFDGYDYQVEQKSVVECIELLKSMKKVEL